MSGKVSSFAAGIEDVTEIISVVRIGVSLVEYIYKVFSSILKDSGGSEVITVTCISCLRKPTLERIIIVLINI
jgi:hypothetical protein